MVVIGGGAAGMAAAIAAGECGDRVLLLERMDRVGRKLLATGNGRCNLMNRGVWRYPGGTGFAAQVLTRCDAAAQTRFWQRHGLYLRQEEDGRVYPVSGQASTVLDVLRLAMDTAGVTIHTSSEVTALRQRPRGWEVVAGAESIRCDRVIVAGGGCAQPRLGSNGSCYDLLTPFGHRRTALRPALTQIETDPEPLRGLSGIRVKATVSVVRDGTVLRSERGEVLFADYGVSGVCVMQCARDAAPGTEVSVNLLDGMGLTRAEVDAELRRRCLVWAQQPAEQLLTGLCVPRLALALGKQAQVRFRDRAIGSLSLREVGALTDALGAFRLRVRGVKGFDSAQVTSGGLRTEDFVPETMESRLVPGLHAAGEVLDVDGDCGGYNLMFAFGSGLLAGLNGRENPDGGERA